MLSLVALSLSASSGRAGPAVVEPSNSEEDSSSLFAQSAAEALARDFPDRDTSFLLMDAHTGHVLASRWDRPDAPIPMGSLLKPFTALAYGEQHNYQYPTTPAAGRPPDAGCLAGTATSI